MGIAEEVLLRNLLRRASFARKVFLKTIIYLAILYVIFFISTFLYNSVIYDKPITNPEVISSVLNFVGSFAQISIFIYCGLFISISLFVSEIIDYLGLDVVKSFFTGKYNKPAVENRIFMFLDLNGSTPLAEQLGLEAYYSFVNQYYRDMTGAITDTQGEIYQYVGDEIVVSWKHGKTLKPINAVKCFFLIRERMQNRAANYLSKYGVVPQFKAGLHIGSVTRGQVGVIKKEMLFTGDVLNTASRIQALCKELNVDLLISEELQSLLQENTENAMHFEDMGWFQLRGKHQKTRLYHPHIPEKE